LGPLTKVKASHLTVSHAGFLIVIIVLILISRGQWITITIKITIKTESAVYLRAIRVRQPLGGRVHFSRDVDTIRKTFPV